MALTPGVRLGSYEILSALGAGGMGEVYKARDTRLDRIVAIKVLPAHLSGDSQFRERFEREARVVAALNHPHICSLHDIGAQDGVQFLVLEYLDGETLGSRLEKGPLPLDSALRYAIEIAGALDAAHRAGITHRDLKPGNVMVTKAGIKLLDFGLAKASARVSAGVSASGLPTASPSLTERGTVLGTFQYMAPEQIEGQDADARTDIFAFGVVLYEMLTGKKAFSGKTQASLFGAILKDTPPAISTLQPLTPQSLDRVVNTCLAKDPDDRWQTARDLVRELKWVAEGSSVAAASSQGTAARAPSKRRERVAWAIAAVAVLAVVALAVIAFRRTLPLQAVMRFDVNTPPTSAVDFTSFALSNDGKQLVFVATSDGVSRLWLRPLDRTTAQPLPGTDGATYPFWSPNGASIGFFADGKLKRLDLPGGVPQTLADAPLGRGGTWNQDDVILFAPSVTNPLMRVGATGGASTAVTQLNQGATSHRGPEFLPDGRRFLFAANYGGQERAAFLGSLDGATLKSLFPARRSPYSAYSEPGYILSTEQGALVARPFMLASSEVGDPIVVAQPVGQDGNGRGAFSVSESGVLAYRPAVVERRQLVWFDRTGKRLGTVGPVDDSALRNPAVASDQRRVVVERTVENNQDVWVLDQVRNNRARVTVDALAETSPVWSPDGSRIIYGRGRELLEKHLASGVERKLFSPSEGRAPNAHDWSSNGRFLLYSVLGENTGNDLWALPLEGGGKPIAIATTAFIERNGQFSPDGRWVVYDSNESGRFEVYVQAFLGSRWKAVVSTEGGSSPRWRRDGKELFYLAPDGTMMSETVQAAADNQSLEVGRITPLFRAPIVFGGFAPPPGNPRQQYDVSPDGQRFLINTTVDDATVPPITITLNWAAGLKK